MIYITRILFLLVLFLPSLALANWQSQIRHLVQNGSVLAADEKGNVLFSHNDNQLFTPASTLKVPLALAALKYLGADFRFKTEFFLDKQKNLWVKGYGDPFLVSEEIALLAGNLTQKGLKKVNNIYLDQSFFEEGLKIDGLVGSLNPYDAYNAALVANFNTLNVYKNKKGQIRSAESQTPLTEITPILAKRAPVGKSRINVATHQNLAPLYFGYLLKEFLKGNGVEVKGKVLPGKISSGLSAWYTHRSSKNLAEVLKAGLKYSQNLIMNQIFLSMGAKAYGAPATLEKGQRFFRKFLKEDLGLQQTYAEEGSGISRKNKTNVLEMDRVLVEFFPYYNLLPVKQGMWVKTGTLSGVSCLVGYFQSTQHGWVRFAILLNQSTSNREKIARILKANL